MKRDMDLVRAVLLQVEALPPGAQEALSNGEWDGPTFVGHVAMLIEAGYVDGRVIHTLDGFACMASDLTWAGRELLDNIKNDTVWQNTKRVVKEKGGSASIEVLTSLAAAFARAHFGLPP